MKRIIILALVLGLAAAASAEDEAFSPNAGAFGLNSGISSGNSYYGIRWYATDALYLDPYVGASIMEGSNQGSYIGYLGIKGIFEKELFSRLRAGFGLRADIKINYQTMKTGSPSESFQYELGGGPVFALQYMVFPKVGIYGDMALLFKYVGYTNMDTDEKTWTASLDTKTAALGIVFYF